MSDRMSETATLIYEQLTSRTFYVIDTEYTAASDAFGGNRIISIAVVPIINGRRAPATAELYRVMNPGVSISAASSRIHGFTDDAVHNKRDFAFHADAILEALTDPDGVIVSHTNVDLHALRNELARLDDRRANGDPAATRGLASLPELPVIDTSILPRQVKLPGIKNAGIVSLARLCELTGVPNKSAHNARSDARATADAFIKLLEHAAKSASIWDIDGLLAAHHAGSTLDLRGPAHIGTEKPQDLTLPVEHITKHTAPLTDAADRQQIKDWVTRSIECATLRCQWLRDEVRAAGNLNADKLIDPLMEQLDALTEPGQASTLLGAIHDLIDPVERDGKPGMAASRALLWWNARHQDLASTPACETQLDQRCPACRVGEPCPRDIMHQPVARVAVFGRSGGLTAAVVKAFFKSEGNLRRWSDATAPVKAHAAWLIINNDFEREQMSSYSIHLARAMELDLHRIEPRLTLLACELIAASDGTEPALALAEDVLTRRTSDPGFSELAQWVTWIEHAQTASTRKAAKKLTTFHRLARPEGRTNHNPYDIKGTR